MTQSLYSQRVRGAPAPSESKVIVLSHMVALVVVESHAQEYARLPVALLENI